MASPVNKLPTRAVSADIDKPQDSEGSARAAFEHLFAENHVVEEFTPLEQSVLWRLSNRYWAAAGLRAFTRDAVPYHVTSDGTLSIASAELIVRHLRSLEAVGRPAASVTVLELGPGSGLFARLLVRRYADLREKDADLPKLSYLGVERSRSMIEEVKRRGIVAAPDVDVDFVLLDIAEDIENLEMKLRSRLRPETLVVTICNYVLDSLPTAFLRRDGDAVMRTEMEVRLDVDGNHKLKESAPESVASRLDGASASIVVRSRERPVDSDDPLSVLAVRYLESDGAAIPLNLTALRCLEVLVRLTAPDGLTLVNDYTVEVGAESGQSYQSFAGSIASGIHFPTLDAFVRDHLGAQSVVPRSSISMIVSRLILQRGHEVTEDAYQDIFSLGAARRAHAYVALARMTHESGRLQQAAASYERAVDEQPENWSILTEAAGFLSARASQSEAAERLARLALAANPICGPAWNVLGDCRYKHGDFASARAAYESALSVDSDDARAHLNMVYCDCAESDLTNALKGITRALVADANGPLTPEILERQKEIIGRLSKKRGRG